MKQRLVLYADEGKVLTNGEIYGKQVFLSESDNVENYHEITDTEYEQMLAEQENF